MRLVESAIARIEIETGERTATTPGSGETAAHLASLPRRSAPSVVASL